MEKKDNIILRKINTLKPHPRNYKKHPEDQIKHICKSIQENGIYRNIVITTDGTILAGHGVVLACEILKIDTVPTFQINISPTSSQALKLLASDNEIGHLADVDDRQLSEILKEILEEDDLLGTGYDEMMLANLAFITRPESELSSINHAEEWVGLPEYERTLTPRTMTVSFENDTDRDSFAKHLGITITNKTKSIWWPHKDNDDVKSIRFENEKT